MATKRPAKGRKPAKPKGKKTVAKKVAVKPQAGRALEFNHAMIYTSDYPRALGFYRDLLGFRLIDEYPGAYGRLQSPGGKSTIALHLLEPGKTMEPTSE